MKRFTSLALFITLFAAGACSDRTEVLAPDGPQFGVLSADPISVLSRNLYLGANIDPLITPGADPGQVIPAALAELQRTNYPARAAKLALEIAARDPQLVGLQEVTRYVFATGPDPLHLTPTGMLDFLGILVSALGGEYEVAVQQSNVSLALPLGGGNWVVYTDGDAILKRSDVVLDDSAHGHYENQVSLNVGGYQFDNLRGWVAVTAELNGRSYRFYNTHLEIQAFRPYQAAQARELAGMLAAETLPVLQPGDINSATTNTAPAGAARRRATISCAARDSSTCGSASRTASAGSPAARLRICRTRRTS
ncbi:MAG: hypothetical protein FIB01_16390 [Gemmatimonadetes bacterium]|nr:hypothetical protein [Gemmatimonadota bacterium]